MYSSNLNDSKTKNARQDLKGLDYTALILTQI